jgi:dipeptidase
LDDFHRHDVEPKKSQINARMYKIQLDAVIYAYNPRYLGGRYVGLQFKASLGKKFWRPISINFKKKHLSSQLWWEA